MSTAGVSREASHSWEVNSQRYACDFLILDDSGKSCQGNPSSCDSYYCYGRTVFAPADGVVEEIRSDCKDSRIFGGKTDPLIRDIRGNYVLLRHTDLNHTEPSPTARSQEYSLLAHLMPGSIPGKERPARQAGRADRPVRQFRQQHGAASAFSGSERKKLLSFRRTSDPF